MQHTQQSDQRIDFKQFRKSQSIEVIRLSTGGRILGFSVVQAPSLGHLALYSLDGFLESERANGVGRTGKLKIGAVNITDLAVLTTHKRLFDVGLVCLLLICRLSFVYWYVGSN